MALNKALLAQLAANTEGVDQTVATQNEGGNFSVPPGRAFVRCNGYIELGTQMRQDFNTKQQKPVDNQFVWTFEVFPLSKKADPAQFVNADGSPKEERTFMLKISTGAKSTAFKAFSKLRNDDQKAFPELIGNPYIANFLQSDKDPKAGQFRLDEVGPAINPITDEPYDVPEMVNIRYFSWQKPSIEQWESLYNSTKEGPVLSYSQRLILGAVNFEGSPAEHMLKQAGILEKVQAEAAAAAARKAQKAAGDAPRLALPEGEDAEAEMLQHEEEEVKAVVMKKAVSALPKVPKRVLAVPEDDEE
jgi:hypothetical protein